MDGEKSASHLRGAFLSARFASASDTFLNRRKRQYLASSTANSPGKKGSVTRKIRRTTGYIRKITSGPKNPRNIVRPIAFAEAEKDSRFDPLMVLFMSGFDPSIDQVCEHN
jgi:hypothetical protein